MNNNVQLTSVLCIPHVFLDVSPDKVSKAFKKQNLGDIQSICMISKISNKNEKYNTANISIRWYNNPQSIAARQMLAEGSEFRVYYNGPWYWNVYNYELKKTFVPKETKSREVDVLIAASLDLRLSEPKPKLNPTASEFKPIQMNSGAAEYKPKKPVTPKTKESEAMKSQPKEVKQSKKEKYDAIEHERRCKKLMKGVILSGTIGINDRLKTSEIEISYEGVSPIPPPLRRQISKNI